MSAAAPVEGAPVAVVLRLDSVPVASTAFPGVMSYTFPADASVKVSWGTSDNVGKVTWTDTCGVPVQAPVPGQATSAPLQTPPPWHQSYARTTADEKCLTGWNPSWAQWPNHGNGGWVCVRTLTHNNSTKAWDVS